MAEPVVQMFAYRVQPLGSRITEVYNFEVQNTHTDLVGDANNAVRGHNICRIAGVECAITDEMKKSGNSILNAGCPTIKDNKQAN